MVTDTVALAGIAGLAQVLILKQGEGPAALVVIITQSTQQLQVVHTQIHQAIVVVGVMAVLLMEPLVPPQVLVVVVEAVLAVMPVLAVPGLAQHMELVALEMQQVRPVTVAEEEVGLRR
jgi:hypothetical protein